MKDIAAEANVSRTTVSFVLSGRCEKDQKISPQVVKKVRETAEKLGYIPNDLVQGFVKGKSRVLGIISTFPDYLMPLVRGYSDEAARHGYSLRLIPLEKGDINKALMSALRARVEGVALVGVTESIREKADWDFFLPKLPVSGLMDPVKGRTFRFNQEKSAALVVDHFVEMGYKKIFCIYDKGEYVLKRKEGYCKSMKEHLLQEYLFMDSPEENCFEKVICGKPEAVFCGSDYLAARLLQEMSKHFLRCPDDFAVAGFGNLVLSRFTSPPLTTVEEPYYENAVAGCRNLIHFIRTGESLPREEIIGRLIIRGSTGKNCEPEKE